MPLPPDPDRDHGVHHGRRSQAGIGRGERRREQQADHDRHRGEHELGGEVTGHDRQRQPDEKEPSDEPSFGADLPRSHLGGVVEEGQRERGLRDHLNLNGRPR